MFYEEIKCTISIELDDVPKDKQKVVRDVINEFWTFQHTWRNDVGNHLWAENTDVVKHFGGYSAVCQNIGNAVDALDLATNVTITVTNIEHIYKN